MNTDSKDNKDILPIKYDTKEKINAWNIPFKNKSILVFPVFILIYDNALFIILNFIIAWNWFPNWFCDEYVFSLSFKLSNGKISVIFENLVYY